MHAHPPARVDWIKDGALINHENKTEQHEDGQKGVLILAAVKNKDLGVYQCTATNKLGEMSKDITVTGEKNLKLFLMMALQNFIYIYITSRTLKNINFLDLVQPLI